VAGLGPSARAVKGPVSNLADLDQRYAAVKAERGTLDIVFANAAAEIAALSEKLGFSPIKLGGLSEGGLLVHARENSWGQLIFKDLVKFD
jgi:predicted dinucleotide-binding enzyme